MIPVAVYRRMNVFLLAEVVMPSPPFAAAVDKLGKFFKKAFVTGKNMDNEDEKKIFEIPTNRLNIYN